MSLPLTLFFILLIIAFASFVQAATGFGCAIVSMSFLPLLLPYQKCLVISAVMIVSIALHMISMLRASVNIRLIFAPIIGMLLMIWPGILLIRALDAHMLRTVMGCFLLFLAPYFYFTKRQDIRIKATSLRGLLIGMLTGMTTGMFNIVGPFFAVYYYDNVDTPIEFKVNLECCFLIAGLFSCGINLSYVQMDWFLATVCVLTALVSVLAGMLGIKVYRKVNKRSLGIIIPIVLALMGLLQLI